MKMIEGRLSYPEAGDLAWYMDGYKRQRSAKRNVFSNTPNSQYFHSVAYRLMHEMFYGKIDPEYGCKPEDSSNAKGVIAGRAMSDLIHLSGQDAFKKGYYAPNQLFRQSLRALYQLGNLRTSRTARRYVEKALANIEKADDKFEYAMSQRMAEMMLEEVDRK